MAGRGKRQGYDSSAAFDQWLQQVARGVKHLREELAGAVGEGYRKPGDYIKTQNIPVFVKENFFDLLTCRNGMLQ